MDSRDPPTCPEHTPLGPLRTAGRYCPRCGQMTNYLFVCCANCATEKGTCVMCGRPVARESDR